MKGILKVILYSILIGACQNAEVVQEAVQETEQSKVNPDWIELDGATYSFIYPALWDLDTSGVNSTQFVVLSQRVDSLDVYTENINLVTENVGETLLDDYVKLSESQIEEFMNKGSLLKTERKEGCHYLKFQAMNNGTMFIFDQFYYVKNGLAYILTFSAEETAYDQMSPLAQKVMLSFKLK